MTKKLPQQKRIQQILDAAVEEFLEHGYDGATMASIARRSGLTKGGVYHHFTGKDEILLAANERLHRPLVEMMERAEAMPSADAAMRAFIRDSLDHWERNPRVVVFAFLSRSKALSTTSVPPRGPGYSDAATAFLESMLQRGVDAGEYRSHDVPGRALALMAALDGVSAQLVSRPERFAGRAAASLERVFLDGVREIGAR